jgi:ABC-type multidrug transport system ATPase subunit
MYFLEADCIEKSFRGRRILSSASIRATQGEVRVLFGRNGIGKSTLIKIAAGIMKADTGTIRLNNEFVARPSGASLARAGVFYLPDHFFLSRSYTIAKQLYFFEQRFGRQSASEAARIAQVQHLLGKLPQNLSGGELRRAELAVALTRRPDCFIADEPYRGIAPVDHDLLAEILRDMAADGCAVVVTGHEVPSLLEVAHQVTWCTSGTTHQLGTAQEARANEAFRRDYLAARRSD